VSGWKHSSTKITFAGVQVLSGEIIDGIFRQKISIDSGTVFYLIGINAGMKKFILNSDNFGLSKDFNRAVLNGYNNGFLRSASITANGVAFDAAINEILPECQKLSVGMHLNLTDGKALTRVPLLTDEAGNFKFNFVTLWVKSYQKDYLSEIEKEFRAQIEKLLSVVKISHIDSMKHIHSIPPIFELVCKLAEEYNIPYVRTHFEEFFIIPDLKSNLNIRYPFNLVKIITLNLLSLQNKKTLKNYNLKTNNYLLGVIYSGMFSNKVVEAGLKTLSDEDDFVVECPISPACYLRNINDNFSKEFNVTQDKILEDTIYRMGFEL